MRKQVLDSIFVLAKKSSKIVYIGSDLGPNVLKEFKHKFPNRFFMEGAYEQHLISMAAGMSLEGFIPYVNQIATFLTRRCYEQICINLGMQNCNVRLIGNGAGLVYSPLGTTHLATDDIALMRVIPNVTILAPADAMEMKNVMAQTLLHKGPIYVRIAKGGDEICSNIFPKSYTLGNIKKLSPNSKTMLISTGIMLNITLKIFNYLKKNNYNDIGLIHLPTLKPINKKQLIQSLKDTKYIATFEEHSIIGGLGSIISDFVTDNSLNNINLVKFGLPDKFPEGFGQQHNQFLENKIDFKSCLHKLIKFIN